MARRKKQNDEIGCGTSLLLLGYGVGAIWVGAKFGWIWVAIITVTVFAMVAWIIWQLDKRASKREKPVKTMSSRQSKGWQQALDGEPASKEDMESLLMYRSVSDDFDKALLEQLARKPDPDMEGNINYLLMRSGNYDQMELYRFAQIMRDSIYLALHSKKREIAESRLQSVIEMMEKIGGKRRAISPDTYEKIVAIVKDTEEKFHTVFYVNIAQGLEERASKLKTKKAKLKYWSQAIDMLMEGVANGKGDTALLGEHINRFKAMMENSTVVDD